MTEASGVPSPAQVPELLREIPRWCRWRREQNRAGKWTRVPDQSTLVLGACRELAATAGPADNEQGRGFVFTGGVPVEGGHLVALDLDVAVDAAGKWAPWAAELLAWCASWAEWSPSGRGVRVWLVVRQLPANCTSKARQPGEPTLDGKLPELQVFGLGAAGYVTVTGRPVPGAPATVRVVDSLEPLQKWGVCRPVPTEGKGTLPVGPGPVPTLEAITARVTNGPDGAALVAGRWKATRAADRSASEAFHRLACLALEAAEGHGAQAVAWLLRCTAWGRGAIDDSAEPERYTRRAWVHADVCRIAARSPAAAATAFDLVPLPPAPAEAPLAAAEKPKPALLIPHREFLARRAKQLFLVDGVLPRTGLAQVYGDPGCGKTPFALSLALHVAAGRGDWFGHGIATGRRGVAYLVGEDANGLGWRAEAQAQAMGITPQQLEPLVWSTRAARLDDEEDAGAFVAAMRELLGAGAALVVVDTQSRNFGTGDENSTQDMTRFVHHLARVAELLGCLVLLVHHTGHTAKERARGSSVLFGALDASYAVKREGSMVTMEPTKSKNWQDCAPLRGRLVPVSLPDGDGGTVSAITLQASTDAEHVAEAVAARVADAKNLAVLRALAVLDGKRVRAADLAAAADVPEFLLRRAILPELQQVCFIEAESGDKTNPKGTVWRVTEAGAAQLLGL